MQAPAAPSSPGSKSGFSKFFKKMRNVKEIFSETSDSPMGRLKGQPDEADDQFFLNLHVIEARFVPVHASHLTYIVLGTRARRTDANWQTVQTTHYNQRFRVVMGDMFTVRLDSNELGGVELLVEWWDVIHGQHVVLGRKAMVLQKSIDDQWFPIRATDKDASIIIRLAISLSKEENGRSSSEILRDMFAQRDSLDKYGTVVDARYRWDYGVQASLHQWLETRQRPILDAYLATPIAHRSPAQLSDILWRGVPKTHKHQFLLLLSARPYVDMGQYSYLMTRAPIERASRAGAGGFSSVSFSSSSATTTEQTNGHIPVIQLVDAEKMILRLFGAGNRVTVTPEVVLSVLAELHETYPQLARQQNLLRIATSILVVLAQESVTRVLIRICDVFLVRLVGPSTLNLRVDSHVFSVMSHSRIPHLMSHLDELKFPAALMVADWHWNLLCGVLPTDSWLRIVDVMLHEGAVVIHAVAIALLRILEPQLLPLTNAHDIWTLLTDLAAHMYDISNLLHEAQIELSEWGLAAMNAHVQVSAASDSSTPKHACSYALTVQKILALEDGKVKELVKDLPQREKNLDSLSTVGPIQLQHLLPDLNAQTYDEIFSCLDSNHEGWINIQKLYNQSLLFDHTNPTAIFENYYNVLTADRDIPELSTNEVELFLSSVSDACDLPVGLSMLSPLLPAPPITSAQTFIAAVENLPFVIPCLNSFINAIYFPVPADQSNDDDDDDSTYGGDRANHKHVIPQAHNTDQDDDDDDQDDDGDGDGDGDYDTGVTAGDQHDHVNDSGDVVVIAAGSDSATAVAIAAIDRVRESTDTINNNNNNNNDGHGNNGYLSATTSIVTSPLSAMVPKSPEHLGPSSPMPRVGSELSHFSNPDSNCDFENNNDDNNGAENLNYQQSQDIQQQQQQQQQQANINTTTQSTPEATTNNSNQPNTSPTTTPNNEPCPATAADNVDIANNNNNNNNNNNALTNNFVRLESLNRFEGWYECEMYDDFVCVRQDGKGECVWYNRAGASWLLTICADDDCALAVGEDCPYIDMTPRFKWEFDQAGKQPLRVFGPWDQPYEFRAQLDASQM